MRCEGFSARPAPPPGMFGRCPGLSPDGFAACGVILIVLRRIPRTRSGAAQVRWAGAPRARLVFGLHGRAQHYVIGEIIGFSWTTRPSRFLAVRGLPGRSHQGLQSGGFLVPVGLSDGFSVIPGFFLEPLALWSAQLSWSGTPCPRCERPSQDGEELPGCGFLGH